MIGTIVPIPMKTPKSRKLTESSLAQILTSTKVDRSHGAPALKKPLLLLLLVSWMEQSKVVKNEFHFSDVQKPLDNLIRRFGGKASRLDGKPEQPFFYLKSDGFWEFHQGGRSGMIQRIR